MKLKPAAKAFLILTFVGAVGFGINTAMNKGLFKTEAAPAVIAPVATPAPVPVAAPAPVPEPTPAVETPNAGLDNLLKFKK